METISPLALSPVLDGLSWDQLFLKRCMDGSEKNCRVQVFTIFHYFLATAILGIHSFRLRWSFSDFLAIFTLVTAAGEAVRDAGGVGCRGADRLHTRGHIDSRQHVQPP